METNSNWFSRIVIVIYNQQFPGDYFLLVALDFQG